MNLKDKYVVITGASSGFGRAAAVAFAGEGAHLILGARRVERLNETAMLACKAGAGSVLVVPVDVTRTESVEDFGNTIAQATKSVQVLINNAGGALGVDTVLNGKDEDSRSSMWAPSPDASLMKAAVSIAGQKPLNCKSLRHFGWNCAAHPCV